MNTFNNTDIIDIVEKHGTPAYIYYSGIIDAQINKLVSAFDPMPVNIHFACKANSNIEVLSYLKDKQIGVDTVSREEATLCMELGFKKTDILYTPSFPSVEDLLWAIDHGLKVHINSMDYLPLLAAHRSNIEIGIRINPEIALSGDPKISTGHIDSKFGVPISKLDQLLTLIKNYKIKVTALHLHPGSGILDWKKMAASADKLFDIIPFFPDLKYIDLGSGYKVKYKSDDLEIDINNYANHINKKLKSLDRSLDLIIEPGKFLLSDAGVFITQVELVKQGVRTKFVGVNSGFNHLLRPMYYEAYHEIINISNTDGKKEIYDIVGYLCEEDTFAYKRSIHTVKRGDYLMFRNAGAYGYSMSSNYNLRKKPVEIFVKE